MKLLDEPEFIDLTFDLEIENVDSLQTGFLLYLTFKRITKRWFFDL
jgi:hypothetical protein